MGGSWLNVRWDPSSDPENWRVWTRSLGPLGNMIEELAPQFGFSGAFVEALLEKGRIADIWGIDFYELTEDELCRMYQLLTHAYSAYQTLREAKDWYERGSANSMFYHLCGIESHLRSTDCDERLEGQQTLTNPHRRKNYTDPWFHTPAQVYFEITRRFNELEPRLQPELFEAAPGAHSQPPY